MLTSATTVGIPTPQDRARGAWHSLRREHPVGIERGDWESGFERLGLLTDGFAAADVSDLFRRADEDADGRISLSDFLAFAATAPKLVDALYFRSKARVREHQEETVEHKGRQRLQIALNHLGTAQGDLQAAEAEDARCREDATSKESQFEAAKQAHADALNEKFAAKADSDAAREAHSAAANHREESRRDARDRKLALAHAEAGLRLGKTALDAADKDLESAVQELERIKALLRSQEVRVEAAQKVRDDAAGARDQAQERSETAKQDERQGDADAAAADQDLQERYAAARKAEDREREADRDALLKERDLERAQDESNRATNALEAATRKRENAAAAFDRSEQDKAAAERQKEAEDGDLEEQRQKRFDAEVSENQLLLKEYEIGKRRETVERDEGELASEHRNFTDGRGRPTSPRASAARGNPQDRLDQLRAAAYGTTA
eukprot:Hpha_TRINITY_DN253_c0_g1::TRINITY_DN253_c0_g1_i1::g.83627::m.83627